MTTVRVNRMHHPLTVLGHGVRAGVWLQGCTIGCAGCSSRDTWDPDGGAEMDPVTVVRWLDSLPGRLDGITISGGEPFQQPAGLVALLSTVDGWRRRRAEPVDVLVFSGYPWSRLAGWPERAEALAFCDAVVAGPYVERRNSGSALRGSDNQKIVTLTELGRQRYGEASTQSGPAMQMSLDGDTVRLIGIPRQGDLERIRAGLAARGIAAEAVTWLG